MIEWIEENADMAGTYPALLRAARRAAQEARRYGLPLAIWRDGRVVRISPDEFERDLDKAAPPPQKGPERSVGSD